MGYACPVCEVPQQDGEHLANHLAFTAMLHGGPHEAWLDDHAADWDGVADWDELDPAALAKRVEPLAEAADYDAVFDDTSDGSPPDVSRERVSEAEGGVDDVYREARRLTEEMRDGE